jgi:uncharacterized protein
MTLVKNNVLITGASGLIGTRLTELLLKQGNTVLHLGRSKRESHVPSFTWDIQKQVMDAEALRQADTIIHLAGANVGDKRWTKKRKQEILESRTKSTRLLFDTLRTQKHAVRNFISAAGMSYYGFDNGHVFTEDDAPGNGFLADVSRLWEQEADRIGALGIRVVKLRTGIVLSKKGGALKELVRPVKYFVGAPLGAGNQYMSWIHIDDLCSMFIKAINDPAMHGAYNAVTQDHVTNREMTKAIGEVLHRPVFLPAVPGILLKLVLGEMAQVVLQGSRVSGEKILQTGYKPRFGTLKEALKDLLG